MSDFNRGCTVEPAVSYDNEGQEYLDYDNADLSWAGDRNNVIRDFDQNQSDLLEFSSFNGDIQHRYSDPARDMMAGGALPPDDVDRLMDLGGGMDNYLAMTAWAEANLPSDYVRDFNALIATNDFEEIENAITGLYNYYLENASGYEYSDEEYFEEDDETLEEDVAFNESILNHFSRDGYSSMIEWASENLPAQYIETYNQAMDSQDHDYKSSMVNWLADSYSQYN